MMLDFQIRHTPGAKVEKLSPNQWRLGIPAGPAGRYRWAQLDDYMHCPRSAFRWKPPFHLELRARVSAVEPPGTWGFGLWNDPFSVSLGLRGMARRLPALPNAAWFFFASRHNYLTLRDDHPAKGLLAATFSSPAIPSPLLALGLLSLPLLAWPPTARFLRRLARRFVQEDAARLEIDPTEWHTYCLEWHREAVHFLLDGDICFETNAAPRAPLGLVVWIDNQYAAFPPEGRLRFGTLPYPEPAWLEVVLLEAGTQ